MGKKAETREWWWKFPKSRHPRAAKDTKVIFRTKDPGFLEKGSFISPVRKCYLSPQHHLHDYYDESIFVLADTPVGFGLVPAEDIDWE